MGLGLVILLAVVVVAFTSGFTALMLASARGHHSIAFFWIGLILPVVGIFAAGMMPDRSRG